MKASKLYLVVGALALASCTGSDGNDGVNGPQGPVGPSGPSGPSGQNGQDGRDGQNGSSTTSPGPIGVAATDPLSSVVALSLNDADPNATIPSMVKARVAILANGAATPRFPIDAATTDTMRAAYGLHHNVVVKWLDPLTTDISPGAPRFGGNADYIAFFGDAWNAVAGAAPQWNGSGSAGWLWVNHEYVSNTLPAQTTPPAGQHLTLAKFLRGIGALAVAADSYLWTPQDIDSHIAKVKQQIGGSWLRVVQDPSSGEWAVDRSAKAQRYDATSGTLTALVGAATRTADHDDTGGALPAGVIAGIAGDCSGAQTPWGTVISAEENVQDYYGDLEACWDGNQKFVAGAGFDSGADIAPVMEASVAGQFGRMSVSGGRHARDGYGYLVEIDPGVASGEYLGRTSSAVGHKKLGAFGRARWENATFVTDGNWKLVPGNPVVVYASDDRRGGRIFKFVSSAPYTAGMTRAQTRALLDSGTLYAAHFAGLDNSKGDRLLGNVIPTEAAPGAGRWIKLSTTSTDIAPNASALGMPTRTVGEALRDRSWNRLGGFPDDAAVRLALFTAAAKVGIMELNRPEDVEWNPLDLSGTPRLYVAFTNHTGQVALDQEGRVFDPAMHATLSPKRADSTGSVFALQEADPANPGSSTTFSFFRVWAGTKAAGVYDAANPDNLVIDRQGGVWFGTDGNFGTNGHSDAVYYLDLDPAHRTTLVPTYGKAFRVAGVPSDAEATGPAFSADMRTLFLSVQHPGEDRDSVWPPR